MGKQIQLEAVERRVLFSVAVAGSIRINAGGPGLVDSIGRAFQGDGGFTGGQAVAAAYDVPATTDDALFASYRIGADFSFSESVANGYYAVFLDFADPTSTAAGQRTFDVRAEGQQVLHNVDLYQSAGQSQWPVAKSFNVDVTDGEINLRFQGVAGDAIVSGIVLVPTDVPLAAQPYSWLGLSDAQRVAKAQSNLVAIGQDLYLYLSTHKGIFPPDLASTLYSGSGAKLTDFANPRTSTAALVPRGELNDFEQFDWAVSRNDYLYLVAGMRYRDITPSTVLAYENPNREYGDIGIVWGDAHVSMMSRADAAALIGFPDQPPSDPPPQWPATPPPDQHVFDSQANLLAIRQALGNWSNDNKGIFPPDLGTLYRYGLITDIHTFINPRGDTQPPPDDWTLEQKVAWINASSDYLFLEPGQRTTSAGQLGAVLSENPQKMSGGINLLLGDGRAEFRESSWAAETLARRTPHLQGAGFSFNSPPQQFTMQFTQPIDAAAVASELVLTNLSSAQTVPTGMIAASYNISPRLLTLTFPGYSFGALPDGDYRATLAAGSITDIVGNTLPEELTSDFFFLNGDANRDRVVDLTDFTILAGNFNGTSKTFAQGDFSYDGKVDLFDFTILASRFNSMLAAPAQSLAAEAPTPLQCTPLLRQRDLIDSSEVVLPTEVVADC